MYNLYKAQQEALKRDPHDQKVNLQKKIADWKNKQREKLPRRLHEDLLLRGRGVEPQEQPSHHRARAARTSTETSKAAAEPAPAEELHEPDQADRTDDETDHRYLRGASTVRCDREGRARFPVKKCKAGPLR